MLFSLAIIPSIALMIFIYKLDKKFQKQFDSGKRKSAIKKRVGIQIPLFFYSHSIVAGGFELMS